MYKIYRIVIYYRFFRWLIPVKKSKKMYKNTALVEAKKIMGVPVSSKFPSDDLLKNTVILSGSHRRFKYGKRMRLIAE